MTQEEKQLLLKDLCARLPYGIKVNVWEYVNAETLVGLDINKKTFNLEYSIGQPIFSRHNDLIIKPYLRPMFSMTEKEREYLKQHINRDFVDYCNEHHLDNRGLIDDGLALEAPKDMYKIE